jgi:hypothetical protein
MPDLATVLHVDSRRRTTLAMLVMAADSASSSTGAMAVIEADNPPLRAADVRRRVTVFTNAGSRRRQYGGCVKLEQGVRSSKRQSYRELPRRKFPVGRIVHKSPGLTLKPRAAFAGPDTPPIMAGRAAHFLI